MGWGRTLFFGDCGGAKSCEDAERHIASLRRRQQIQTHVDRSQDEELRELRRENGELKLHLAALVNLLIAKNAIDADEFARLVDLIDASDGDRDGQFTGAVAFAAE